MKKSKKILIVLILVLIPIAAVGYNFFIGHDDLGVKTKTLTVDGRFVKDSLADRLDLVPGDTICEDIDIAVTSTADSLLRVKVTAKEGSNEIADNILEVTLTNSSNWEEVGGYYYYKGILNGANQENNIQTIDFIEKIVFDGNNSYQDKEIDIEFDLDLVQYKHKAYQTAWSILEGQEGYEFLEALYNTQQTE